MSNLENENMFFVGRIAAKKMRPFLHSQKVQGHMLNGSVLALHDFETSDANLHRLFLLE